TGPGRGTCLRRKALGQGGGGEIDTGAGGWEQVVVRVDLPAEDHAALEAAGLQVGDWIAFDPQPEIQPDGYINSRYLDDKAAVAALLTACKAIRDHGLVLPRSE